MGQITGQAGRVRMRFRGTSVRVDRPPAVAAFIDFAIARDGGGVRKAEGKQKKHRLSHSFLHRARHWDAHTTSRLGLGRIRALLAMAQPGDEREALKRAIYGGAGADLPEFERAYHYRFAWTYRELARHALGKRDVAHRRHWEREWLSVFARAETVLGGSPYMYFANCFDAVEPDSPLAQYASDRVRLAIVDVFEPLLPAVDRRAPEVSWALMDKETLREFLVSSLRRQAILLRGAFGRVGWRGIVEAPDLDLVGEDGTTTNVQQRVAQQIVDDMAAGKARRTQRERETIAQVAAILGPRRQRKRTPAARRVLS